MRSKETMAALLGGYTGDGSHEHATDDSQLLVHHDPIQLPLYSMAPTKDRDIPLYSVSSIALLLETLGLALPFRLPLSPPPCCCTPTLLRLCGCLAGQHIFIPSFAATLPGCGIKLSSDACQCNH